MKVSVIIPYNIDRGFLSEAVQSAEQQENMQLNTDYEIIVQQGNCGVSENINRALDKCCGHYIKLCAEDDRLAPGCLHALYTFAVKGGYDFVCADAFDFERYPQPLSHFASTIPATVSELAAGNTIHGGTILYRRAAMPRFNEALWTGEEYDVTLRMAAAGCRFGKLDEVVFWYRNHTGQKSVQYRSNATGRAVERFRFLRDEIMMPHWNNQNKIKK